MPRKNFTDPRMSRPRMRSTLQLGLAVGLALGTLAGVGAEAPPARALIPPATEDLEHEGEAAVYRGDQLYDYIDGGAPQYLEYGFREVASQELRYAEHTYIFDVYRMHNTLAAFGIFSVRHRRGQPALEGFAQSAYGGYQAMLAYGPYFLDVTAYESTPQTAAEIGRLVRRGLAAAGLPVPGETSETAPVLEIKDPTMLFPLHDLPPEGLLPETIRLARGPISLRSALGREAKGQLWATLEAMLIALGISPDAAAAPAAGGSAAQMYDWVVAGYHPRATAEDASEPATWIVLLAGPEDLQGLQAAAWEAIMPNVESWGAGAGWVQSREGAIEFLTRREFDLLVGRSRISPGEFSGWLQALPDMLSPASGAKE